MYEPGPLPFVSSHFHNAPYDIAPVADFGFLFAPSGGGAGAGSGLISGPAPATTPHTEPEPVIDLNRHYAHQPVSVASPSSSSSASPPFVAAANSRQSRRRSDLKQPLNMDSQQQPPQHDVAAQQEAAEEYQPELKGPLVGEKTPSDAITHEYARADQVYVEKTIVRCPPPFPGCGPPATASRNCHIQMTSHLPMHPAGAASDILPLPPNPGRWKLWLASHRFLVL
jgi:ubiquitin thioesterase protein OTUB1